jgi:hypothetical protein
MLPIISFYVGLHTDLTVYTESGLPHNRIIWVPIYLFVIYFILVKGKNFWVRIIKLPVKWLLLQPSKYSRSVCSGVMYCMIIKARKNVF